MLQGDLKSARAWYGRGALSPADADAYFLRGNAHLQRADHDQAIADYTEAVRINPKDASAFFNRGLAWAKKGIADRAQADRQKAQEPDPSLGRPK